MSGALLAQDFLALEAHRQQLEARQWQSVEEAQSRRAVLEVQRAHSVGVLEKRLARGADERQRTLERNEVIRSQACFHQMTAGGTPEAPGTLCTIRGRSQASERIRGSREAFSTQVEQMAWQYHEVMEHQVRQDIRAAQEETARCQTRQNEMLQAACRQEELLQHLIEERRRAQEERSKLLAFDREMQERQRTLRERLTAEQGAVDRQLDAARSGAGRAGAEDRAPAPEAAAPAPAAREAARPAAAPPPPTAEPPAEPAAPRPAAGGPAAGAGEGRLCAKPRGCFVPPQGTRQFEVYQRLKACEMEMQSDLRLLEAAAPAPAVVHHARPDWSCLSAKAFNPSTGPPLIIAQQPLTPPPARPYQPQVLASALDPSRGAAAGMAPAEVYTGLDEVQQSSVFQPSASGLPATGPMPWESRDVVAARMEASLAAASAAAADYCATMQSAAGACTGTPMDMAGVAPCGAYAAGRADVGHMHGALASGQVIPSYGLPASYPTPLDAPGANGRLAELKAWAQAPCRSFEHPTSASTYAPNEGISMQMLDRRLESVTAQRAHPMNWDGIAPNAATNPPLQPGLVTQPESCRLHVQDTSDLSPDAMLLHTPLQFGTSPVAISGTSVGTSNVGVFQGLPAMGPQSSVCMGTPLDTPTQACTSLPSFGPGLQTMGSVPPAALDTPCAAIQFATSGADGADTVGGIGPPTLGITSQGQAYPAETRGPFRDVQLAPPTVQAAASGEATLSTPSLSASHEMPSESEANMTMPQPPLPCADAKVPVDAAPDTSLDASALPSVGTPGQPCELSVADTSAVPPLPSLSLSPGELEASFKMESSGEVDMDAWIPMSSRDRPSAAATDPLVQPSVQEVRNPQPSVVSQPQAPLPGLQPPFPLSEGRSDAGSLQPAAEAAPPEGRAAVLGANGFASSMDRPLVGPASPTGGDGGLEGTRVSESLSASFTFADGSPPRSTPQPDGAQTATPTLGGSRAGQPMDEGRTSKPSDDGAGDIVQSQPASEARMDPPQQDAPDTAEAAVEGSGSSDMPGGGKRTVPGSSQRQTGPHGRPAPWQSGQLGKPAMGGLAELDEDEIAGSDSDLDGLGRGGLVGLPSRAAAKPPAAPPQAGAGGGAEAAAEPSEPPGAEQPPAVQGGGADGGAKRAKDPRYADLGLDDSDSEEDPMKGSLEAPSEGSGSLGKTPARRNPLARGRGRGAGIRPGLLQGGAGDFGEVSSPAGGILGASKSSSFGSSLSSLRPKAKAKSYGRSSSLGSMLGGQIDWSQAAW